MKNKWFAIVGSSRRHQNTEQLVDYMIEALRTIDRDVEKILLAHDQIITCDACEACLRTGYCHIEDETADVINRLHDAEGIILASPTYHQNMSAQMKAFLDRTYYMGVKRRESKRHFEQKAIILGVCRGTEKESMGNTMADIGKVVSGLNMTVVDNIEYYNTKDIPVTENQMIKEIIKQRIINLLTSEGEEHVH